VIPNRFANELRNRTELSFNQAFAKDFFPSYPGFEPFKFITSEDSPIQQTVRVKLTQSLNLITPALVEETVAAVHDIFGEDSEWHAIHLKQDILHLVARLTSRVFLGKPLCRNEQWLDVAKNYTVDCVIAAQKMRAVPAIIRPIYYWFIEECNRLRSHVRKARELIAPGIELQKKRAQQSLAAGGKQPPPQSEDAIGWMYSVAQGKDIDYVAGQLSLTLAAVHTTTGALTYALIDLCINPEAVSPLREEVVAIISKHGWTKSALQKLRLMDSFLKESQRCNTHESTSMHSVAQRAITLSDGTCIPAGARVVVAGAYRDSSVYENPEAFEPFRFVDVDEDQKAHGTGSNSWGYAATSAQHMGFGFGVHACPGRFFAAQELKVALCHLIMKYDFKTIGGEEPKTISFETSNFADPSCRVSIRRVKGVSDIGLEGEKIGLEVR
jgi:cytochrome P450